MRQFWILLTIFLMACGGPDTATPPDRVAAWDGGALTLADLEAELATARTPACRRARRGGVEELVPCYRELAEGLVLERLVLAEAGDLEPALGEAGENGDGRALRRQVYLQAFLRDLRGEIEVTDDEIEARYAADPGRYRQTAGVTLSNIFRRHADPTRPEATLAFLREVKERYEAGETFDALAREVSHSETRLRGGLVGRVSEDDLPARLWRVASALEDGEVSDPVRVRGGAVLLHVQGRAEAIDPTLDEVRARIRRELVEERLERAISERIAGAEPPPGSTVLDLEALTAALDTGEDDGGTVVLDVDGDRLTAGQLRRLAGLGPVERATALDAEARDRLAEVYHRQLERRLLAFELVEDPPPELRAEAEKRWREAAVRRLADERIQAEIEALVEADGEALESYWQDNSHHYQSPLAFRLEIWDLPFGDDPPAQLAEMERLRQRLVRGELDLAAAAGELGGEVRDLGWRDFDALGSEMPEKARTYLMELGQPGFSVPYQQDDALHLIQLTERAEPRPLDYAEAGERVRADYLARFQQDLYRRALEERLGDAGFAFDEAAVRRLLAPAAPPAADEAG